MAEKKEGIRRLSILSGGLGSFAWFIFSLFASNGFERIDSTADWLIFVVGLVACFLIPCALVHSINWVILGFRQDKFKK